MAWRIAEGDDVDAGMDRFMASLFVRSDSEEEELGPPGPGAVEAISISPLTPGPEGGSVHATASAIAGAWVAGVHAMPSGTQTAVDHHLHVEAAGEAESIVFEFQSHRITLPMHSARKLDSSLASRLVSSGKLSCLVF